MTLAFVSAAGAAANTAFVRCDVYVAGASAPTASDFPSISVVQARDASQAPIAQLPPVTVATIRCGDATTTTTTTTSTTTSTHAPSSTTTTTLEAEVCAMKVKLESAPALRRVRFELDYSAAGGHLAAPAFADCRGLSGAGIDVGSGAKPRTLAVELVTVTAVHGPADLMICDFVPTTGIAGSDDFKIKVLASSDASGAPTGSLPLLSATKVMCPSLTTTTTTTSTTLPPPPCGDANGDGLVKAGDALAALRMAVGLVSDCTVARCDVDSSGTVKASDSLRILQFSVGGNVILDCTE
jgi:hypothetical protein